MSIKPGPDSLICSARDCEEPGETKVVWHNPTLHYGREKTWLACSKHADSLLDYLAVRGFPARLVSLDPDN